jgi:hypothetical protein
VSSHTELFARQFQGADRGRHSVWERGTPSSPRHSLHPAAHCPARKQRRRTKFADLGRAHANLASCCWRDVSQTTQPQRRAGNVCVRTGTERLPTRSTASLQAVWMRPRGKPWIRYASVEFLQGLGHARTRGSPRSREARSAGLDRNDGYPSAAAPTAAASPNTALAPQAKQRRPNPPNDEGLRDAAGSVPQLRFR